MSERGEGKAEAARPWWYVAPPPWWIWLIALATDVGVGVWRLISTSGGDAPLFLSSLLWPGAVIAGAVLLVCWLGWALDLE